MKSVALAGSNLEDGSFRECARLDIAPQRDEEFPREGDNPDLSGPGTAACEALVVELPRFRGQLSAEVDFPR